MSQVVVYSHQFSELHFSVSGSCFFIAGREEKCHSKYCVLHASLWKGLVQQPFVEELVKRATQETGYYW